MDEFMDEGQLARFKVWLAKRATSAKTIQNRCGEVQNDIPALEAAPMVAARRKLQATQGRVR